MQAQTPNLLSALIWLPIIAGIIILIVGTDARPARARKLALIFSIIIAALSTLLYTGFDTTTAQMQFTEHHNWITTYNINYALGIDGIAMPLILLTTFITVIVVIAAWQEITHRTAQYMAAFLIMEGIIIGVFTAMDAVLFYLFWEAMLIPMFLIIGIWGGANRKYATIKFFLYTLTGSLLMLIALLYLYNLSGSFQIHRLHQLPIPINAQTLIFIAFFAAFAVKIPMFPLHTWLPDAHVQAPTGGSVILAAIMLKMGGYGFIRFNMPITPDATYNLAGIIIALSLISIIYIALIAIAQQDLKKLIAYTSISHMGFVTLGLFTLKAQSLEGALIQMISHGIIAAALFLCVGALYQRLHTRQINHYRGLATATPRLAAFITLFAIANAGLPGTSGFVGEFLVILGAFQVNPWFAIFAALTLIFGAAYTLWMIKRVIYGKVLNDAVAALADINSREILMLSILGGMVLMIGIWPNPILDVMHVSVENLLQHMDISKCLTTCR